MMGVMLSMLLNFLRFGEDNCEFKKYFLFLFVNIFLLIIIMFNLDCCFVFWFVMRYYIYIIKCFVVRLCIFMWCVSFFVIYLMFFNFGGFLGI